MVGKCLRVSNVVVGSVTVNNLFHRLLLVEHLIQTHLILSLEKQGGTEKSQKACHQRQCDLLPPSSPTSTYLAVVNRGVHLSTPRVDYCRVVFAGAPKVITNKLQRVVNAASRVLTGTRNVRPRLDAADA